MLSIGKNPLRIALAVFVTTSVVATGMANAVIQGVAYANAPQSAQSTPEIIEELEAADQTVTSSAPMEEQQMVVPDSSNDRTCVCPDPPPADPGGQPNNPGGNNPGSDGAGNPDGNAGNNPGSDGGVPTPPTPPGGNNPGSDGGPTLPPPGPTPPGPTPPPGGGVSVGDFVWHDVDRDGEQDSGEPGLSGVKLEIAAPGGKVVASTVTDGSGKYLFENLPVLKGAEKYTVSVVEAPEGMKPTVEHVGDEPSDREDDSSTSPAVTEKDLSKPGLKDLSVDFGFVKDPGTPTPPGPTPPGPTPPGPTPPSGGSDKGTPKPPKSGSPVNNADTVVPGKIKTTSTPTSAKLAATGAELMPLAGLTAALLLVGAGTLLVRRKGGR